MNIKERADAAIKRIDAMSDDEFEAKLRRHGLNPVRRDPVEYSSLAMSNPIKIEFLETDPIFQYYKGMNLQSLHFGELIFSEQHTITFTAGEFYTTVCSSELHAVNDPFVHSLAA